jgi:hypothetical protein
MIIVLTPVVVGCSAGRHAGGSCRAEWSDLGCPQLDLELPAFNAAFQALSIEVPANKRLSPREKVTLHNPDDGTRLGKPLEASYGAISFQCVQSSW